MWTFGKRIAVGFAISFMLLAAIGYVSYQSIDSLTKTSYAVARSHTVLDHLVGILSEIKDAETGQRGYVITGAEEYLDPYESGTRNVVHLLVELQKLTADNPSQQALVSEIDAIVKTKLAEMKRPLEVRRREGFEPAQKIILLGTGKKAMDDLRRTLGKMEAQERATLKQRADEVETAARNARSTIIVGTITGLLLVISIGALITQMLTRQIGSAVQGMEGSSSELQAAATQQATGARESATAMSEVTTTINELLATSRQIAEGAQRVAQVAEQTAAAARSGDGTVQRTNDSISSIRKQVDLIVGHMLELGKKSQQIGSVLDIVSELAEQTNILAINATIEAAGAGDSGKRFAVVADEIRKLADRVAGSTKEIRALIEDVRSAVNTTVMTTETGSKSVDAGSRQFEDVNLVFKHIGGLVTTTTEAAREIELSTKQQSTAIEQVNLAISNVAQTTKEAETSSAQTLQAVSQLLLVSKDLLRLVQTRPNP